MTLLANDPSIVASPLIADPTIVSRRTPSRVARTPLNKAVQGETVFTVSSFKIISILRLTDLKVHISTNMHPEKSFHLK